MNAPVRTFEIKQATRQQVPCLVGISGPSGSGKTYSALRLATGMQEVTGGDIGVIDTESRRALHYADRFKFKHVEFGAPFGSLDYLAVIEHVVKQGIRNVVVDSTSHEHEGLGGYLETHAAELERLSEGNAAKKDKNNFTAWIKPAQQRRKLINGLLQLNANFIFCFRAKDKLKIVAGGKPQEMGFMPIAGDEFVYEMMLSILLYPNARGMPTWASSMPGERTMIKLPEQFRSVFLDDNQALDEAAGKMLAQWAAGGAVGTRDNDGAGVVAEAKRIAGDGAAAFAKWWNLPGTKKQWPVLKPHIEEFKEIARQADAAAPPDDADPFGLPPLKSEGAQATPTDRHVANSGSTPEPRSSELCDRLIAQMFNMPNKVSLDEFVTMIASDLASLPEAERGRFATARIEREKAMASR